MLSGHHEEHKLPLVRTNLICNGTAMIGSLGTPKVQKDADGLATTFLFSHFFTFTHFFFQHQHN